MSNNLVFNSVASKLLVLINGEDPSGNTKTIKVDNEGVLILPTVTVTAQDFDIRNLSGATDSILVSNDFVTVTATDLDIRNLSGATDSILISNAFITVSAGDLDIRNLSATTDSIATIGLLTTSETSVASSNTSGAIFTQDTGLSDEFSYYVVNNDTSAITVRVQLSPTTADAYFFDDPNQADTVLGQDDKAILISSLYANYTRLFYQATSTPTDFEVYYTSKT